ncbi:CDP-alcohol phosphatidyltransferase family protein [Asticcacaulis biprosthecium C19]|uniref:CDP-alcohol phosphatidyltransferase family protein n=1 Tax=Asticcacaulis biprosthecium C19 TaxID=715226 RepID=F4QGS4_9CAUL|nr:CDP-alcohol phosphatidyltransferase family protein [Asticcacaulis biprosthecium]EGF92526.1 CDP-alcohol phosphatidyltransferase family protein [Asticcacaulis biprosthecium C19]
MIHHLPFALILFRLAAGPVILAVAWFQPPLAALVCTILLGLGVLSDIFDGVIARRLNIVTNDLRLWDSRCDVVFWLSVAISLHLLHPAIWQVTWLMLAVLGVMEATTHLISYVRFSREASTHHLLSKIFCLFLWALASQIFLTGATGWLFWLTLGVGVVSQLEAMAIMLIVPAWQVDVKSLKAALALRRG